MINQQKKYRRLSVKIIGNVDKNDMILVRMPVEVFEKQILSLQCKNP